MELRSRWYQMMGEGKYVQMSFSDMVDEYLHDQGKEGRRLASAWRRFLLPLEMCDVCGKYESWLVIREEVGQLGRYLLCEECWCDLLERSQAIGCRPIDLVDHMAETGQLGST